MKKIIAFGASSSKTSINKEFATYVAHKFQNIAVEILDLNDYEMPIYSVDKENENGIPQLAQDFYSKLGSADLIIISLAEHNGNYSVAFKNILDWTSRVNMKAFQEKPMLLLATSPGPGGGNSVLKIATTSFPFLGGNVKANFSLPSFNENFDYEKGILTNKEIEQELKDLVQNIKF